MEKDDCDVKEATKAVLFLLGMIFSGIFGFATLGSGLLYYVTPWILIGGVLCIISATMFARMCDNF